ncbi:MAG: 16S rRNA (guanine(966)-N(2))-methyltransferase RsmD [Betaproteobacteria bacterium]|nr:16S rRNA (guanine(966)-N(2))-methyltransferase RsmD [Betaproteobacteria bacterium]
MRTNRVRIIGGAWRSRLIRFGLQRDLRPTPDRVRETLFNWLGQDLTGTVCLDLFAGSGALGFEAASRGAKRVVMVERDPATFSALQASRALLGAAVVELIRGDALEFLRGDSGRYDVVFLDPPFRAVDWPRLLALLPSHMNPGALIYCESAVQLEPPAGWEIWKQGRAGQVRFQLLKRTEHEQQGGVPGNI